MRPRLIVAGASAYPRIIDFERMAAIAHGVGALLFVDMAHIAGLIAAGCIRSPFPHADIVPCETPRRPRLQPPGAAARGRSGDYPNVKGNLAQAIDKNRFPGIQGGPLMHVIAAKAVAFSSPRADDLP